MPLQITALYAGLLALLFVVLAARVIRGRYRDRVELLDGGMPDLARRIRVHANFAEYVPLSLIVMATVEANGARPWIVHGLGVVLVAARLGHAWGLQTSTGPSAGRAGGMVATFAVLVTGGLLAVAQFLGLTP
jgi:uncharacterized protein